MPTLIVTYRKPADRSEDPARHQFVAALAVTTTVMPYVAAANGKAYWFEGSVGGTVDVVNGATLMAADPPP
jgi:hypothetical protein